MRWGFEQQSMSLGRLAHVQDFAISLAELPPASFLRYRDFSPRTFRQSATNFRGLIRIRKLAERYQDLAEFTESGDFSIYRRDRWSYYGRCLQMMPPLRSLVLSHLDGSGVMSTAPTLPGRKEAR